TIDNLIKTQSTEGVGIIPPAPKGKNIWGTVTIGERGQLVIPKGARDKFGLSQGQRLIVLGDEEGIALVPAETFEANLRKAMEMISAQNNDTADLPWEMSSWKQNG
ncbi:MAG: AbrB/MazE/SpoVT family DNA-binding domain-containing protein, partial [Erysipelotrichales bacterium]|nr:AbrB/MazE/SpoVT family DNA-binding domain-containing protein [Erysipelotrichales bacterium]